jgi:hypothetical protein
MVVAPEAIVVRVNGELWGSRLGVAVPVNGGAYVIRAEGKGYEPWEVTVQIAAERDSQRIEVPPLVDADRSRPAPIAPSQAAAIVPPPAAIPADDGSGRRTAGLVIGGIGLAGLAVGATFGALSLAKRSEANCQGQICAGASGTYETARTDATVSTVALIAGGVGLAAGAVLFFTSPGQARADVVAHEASFELVPQVSATGARLELTGRF